MHECRQSLASGQKSQHSGYSASPSSSPHRQRRPHLLPALNISKAIDWFIPLAVRAEPESYRRARVLVGATLLMVAIAIVVRVVRTFSEQGDPNLAVLIPGIVLTGSAPFVLRWTGRVRLAAVIPVVVLVGVAPFATLQTGGLEAPVLVGITVVPVLSTFLLGARLGVACTVVVILELSVLAVLHARGYQFTQRIDPDKRYLFELSLATVAMIMTTVLTWIYERERSAVEDKLRREIVERRRAEQAKDDFVAIVSHELRTPLTAIRGAVELLDHGVYGHFDQPVSDLLAITVRNARSLSLLVDDLLDIRAIEEGKLSVSMTRVSLVPMARDVVNANRALAVTYETEFCLTTNDESVQVLGDPRRLQQVLTNLLSNAAKYTRPGTAVEVAIDRRSDHVRIAITDHGLGIPVAFRKRIFARFAQADVSSTREKRGTGLGLHITRALVEAHDGTIDFDTQDGEGTTFYVELPLY